MSFVKCFDAVTMVTDEATKKFSPTLREDKDKKCELERLCELFDSLAEKLNGIEYETEVDGETTEISVSLTCSEFDNAVSPLDDFCELVNRANRVEFESPGEDKVKITFTLGGIWVSTHYAEDELR